MSLFADWLAHFVRDSALLSTVWLGVAILLRPLLRQPAPRVVWGWCVTVGLAGLVLVAATPGRPRFDWPTTAADRREEAIPDIDRSPPRALSIAGPQQPVRAIAVDQTSNPPVLPEEPAAQDRAGTSPQSLARATEPAHGSTDTTTPVAAPPSNSDRWTGRMLVTSLWQSLADGSLLWLWGGGAVAALVWLLLGAIQTRRLKAASQATPEWVERELRVLTAGSRATPGLLQSAMLDTAVAFGAARPTIILPSRLVEQGPSPILSAMLAHEWAHIRNRDLWLLAMQRLLLPLLALQPLYWWFRRGLTRDQELLADAWAARGDNVNYAAAVLAWIRSDDVRQAPPAPSSVLTFWPTRSLTARRIEMLLETGSPVVTTSSRWTRLGLAGLAATVLLPLALLPSGGALAGLDEAADTHSEADVSSAESKGQGEDAPAADITQPSEPAETDAGGHDANRVTPERKAPHGVDRRVVRETTLKGADAASVVRLLEELGKDLHGFDHNELGMTFEFEAGAKGHNEVVVRGTPEELLLLQRLIKAERARASERFREDTSPAFRSSGSQADPFTELSLGARIKLLELEVDLGTHESRRLREELDQTEALVKKGLAPSSARMAAVRELEQAGYRTERARIQLEDLRERPDRERMAAIEARKVRDRQRAARGATRLRLKELDVRLAQQELRSLEAGLNAARQLREKELLPESELRQKESLTETARLKFEQATLLLEEARQELESE